MLRKSTAFVPRYRKFESISLQRRVCKLSARNTRVISTASRRPSWRRRTACGDAPGYEAFRKQGLRTKISSTTRAACGQHLGNHVLLADVAVGNVLNGNAGSRSQLDGALAHTVTKRLGKSRIVEDTDLPSRKKCRHSLRIARPG